MSIRQNEHGFWEVFDGGEMIARVYREEEARQIDIGQQQKHLQELQALKAQYRNPLAQS
jgi:hypothetical protein